MEVEIKACVFDILSATHEIETFSKDVPDFEAYRSDLKTRRAIERNLEIVGEAMNRIVKRNQNLVFTNAKKVIDTRNRIIHGYDSVSDEIIWSIINDSLPKLKNEMEQYLAA